MVEPIRKSFVVDATRERAFRVFTEEHGAWWPLAIEPTWMQQIAKIGITAWAMEGLNGVMLSGKVLTEVLPDVLGLLGYGLICFLIALRFFRFQEKTA